MTEDIKKEILDTAGQESSLRKSLYLFENIPPKKLNGAINAYASLLGSDETVIILLDTTLLGSAKEGFILTSKRLYSSGESGNAVFADITDITGLELIPSSSPVIRVNVSRRGFNLSFDVSVYVAYQDLFFNLLNTSIRLLSPEAATTADVGQGLGTYEPRCKSCGANNDINKSMCEYCGAELTAARGETVLAENVIKTALPLDGEARYDVIITDIGPDEDSADLIIMEIEEYTGLKIGNVTSPMTVMKAATKEQADFLKKNWFDLSDMVVTIRETK